ncbi:MAG: tol-pal system-associated acyl-CoA thioesterase [Luminiphilus sp.]
MTEGSGEFSLPIRVYIEDTDAGGIVYYVNYLKYFERARTEYMRARGYDKPAFLGEDSLFVVTHADVRYRLPARLDDALRATAFLVSIGAATLTFEQRVYRNQECLVAGEIRIALVDKISGKPKRLPATLRKDLPAV